MQVLFALAWIVIYLCFSRMMKKPIDSLGFIVSLFLRKVMDHHIELWQSVLKFMQSHIASVPRFGYKERDGRICGPVVCKDCRKDISLGKNKISIAQDRALLIREDIEIVMERLGMGSCSEDIENRIEDKCGDCRLLEGVTILLEEKQADLKELEEAFSVFDENKDGFINAIELQRIMCRLEFEEGMNLDDCHRMIQAFDENGDGRIDFHEFKSLMENGV